jgi:hypothetical protein
MTNDRPYTLNPMTALLSSPPTDSLVYRITIQLTKHLAN